MIKSTMNRFTLLYILNDDSEGKKKQIVKCTKICMRYSRKQESDPLMLFLRKVALQALNVLFNANA